MSTFFFGISSRVFKYSHTIGRIANEGLGFRHPMDIVVRRDGLIYVLNRGIEELKELQGTPRVGMIAPGERPGDEEYIGEFGGTGDGDGRFRWPTSIALDSQDHIYVADEWLQRVSVFDKDGTFLDKWGTHGSRDGEWDRPSGIAFDRDDNLYIVDSANHRVQIFTREGRFLDKFGRLGNGEGAFDTPWGITIDRKGEVYVADWRNDRIQKFTADGRFLAKFGSSGDQIGRFNRPTKVATDQDGDIYVADWRNHRVQIFASDFRYITDLTGDSTLSKWGKEMLMASPAMVHQLSLVRDLTPWQKFWFPVAVDVDEKSRIIVAEMGWQRLQVYQKDRVAVGVGG